MLAQYSPPLLPPITHDKRRPERRDIAPERPWQETRFYTKKEAGLGYAPSRDIPIPVNDIPLPEPSSEHNTCLFRDPLDRFVKVTESQGEHNSIIMFCQYSDVTRIETQYKYLEYADGDGEIRSTAFDARISFSDGFRSLVSSKPKVRAEKTGHYALNDMIVDQVDPEVADQIQTITERDLPQWSLANARLFQSVRNDGFWVSLDAMREHARSLVVAITIADFCEPFGGSGKCFRTAVKLLFERHLTLVDAGEIDIGSYVTSPPLEVVQ